MENDNIIINKFPDGTEILQFKRLLEFPNIKHAYTLRKNNINVQVRNADESPLIDSYKKVGALFNLDYRNIVKPHQTHTDRIEIVNNTNEEFNEVDGLITNKKDICLCTTSADCTSLLFYDYKNQVIANVHSGWRGTLQRIGEKTVEKLKNECKCNAENIICCISPCIQKCHFEVDEDVMQMFKNEFESMCKIDKFIFKGRVADGKQKYNIDTTILNKMMLQEEGLLEENIIDSGLCTVCNSELFHSHRVDKEKSGRNGAFVLLIKNTTI